MLEHLFLLIILSCVLSILFTYIDYLLSDRSTNNIIAKFISYMVILCIVFSLLHITREEGQIMF